MSDPDLPDLHIDLNLIRLRINKGPDVLEFNPSDILFIEGFYDMIAEFQTKQVEYQAILNKLEQDNITSTTKETITAMKEICLFARARIDDIFGKGTSQKLFKDVLAFEPIEQFFTGILPHIRRQRAQHLSKFMPPPVKRPRKRKQK